MFKRSDLEALAAYKGKHPVASLYLHLDPRLRGTPDAYRARLRGLLKEVAERAPAEDLAAIEAYFEKEFDWLGRGVAVFSGQADGLWRVEQFAVPIRSYVHVGQKPFIMPLADLMDTYGSYSVAVVDQQAIRMIHFHLGEPVATEELEGEEVRHMKAGGGKGRRGDVSGGRGDDLTGYERETVRGNLRTFAEALGSFCTRHKSEHLLLGGAEPTLAQFRGMLNNPCQERLEGMANIPMQASDKEVLTRSLEVLQANEKAREVQLVETIQTLAAKGANGAVGLENTLNAIHAGRVQTLVLVEGYNAPGYQCRGCSYVTANPSEACPFCSGQLAKVANAAEPAIRRVVEQGGKVEFLDEETLLNVQGGVGALLRY